MDYTPLIEKRRQRLEELETVIAEPDFFNDQKRASETMREHRRLKELMETWDSLNATEQQLADNQELAKTDDPELAELAAMEIPELEAALEKLRSDVQYSLLPRDTTEDRDAIIEIRAGTGGDEASLFAGDLLRMYQRFAEERGWRFEHLESSPSDVGGFKEVVCRIAGEEVFRFLKYEGGVHRVQRVPATETQGRIHTSTATVAVMPEAEEVDIEIRPEDLRIEVCRSGGAGGQHVNKTSSAVRLIHRPTGLVVECQQERSQFQNRDKAMRLLASRLYEIEREKQDADIARERKSQVGSGDRSEKIRTYNFPQGRVTDHRIGLTLYRIDAVLDGELDELIDALVTADQAEKLKNGGGEP